MSPVSDYAEIRTALSFIPSDDREVWYRMASAVRSELGDAGWDIWDDWSKTSEKYSPLDARSTWRSASGRVGIASLFFLARRYGYRPDSIYRPPVIKTLPPVIAPDRSKQQAKTASTSQDMISRARLETHPYLTSKGFPDRKGLVLDGELLIPMQLGSCVVNTQRIQADGQKKFLYGGLVSGCVARLGEPDCERHTFYVEGYATGLSVLAALEKLGSGDSSQVVVCFTAGNLRKVATPGGVVIADNDASRTGEDAARATGLSYWSPPDVDTDANDYHQRYGLDALAKALAG